MLQCQVVLYLGLRRKGKLDLGPLQPQTGNLSHAGLDSALPSSCWGIHENIMSNFCGT